MLWLKMVRWAEAVAGARLARLLGAATDRPRCAGKAPVSSKLRQDEPAPSNSDENSNGDHSLLAGLASAAATVVAAA
jgi:hypothetical protein